MLTMIAPITETDATALASIVIRNLDDEIKKRLKLAAARHGCSMEEEARQILKSALLRNDAEYGLGTRINKLFKEIGGVELPEIPRSMPRPSPFDEEPED